MRVLFLDDNENRHKAFKRVVVGTGVTHVDWVQDAKAAIKYLSDNPKYDIICFDHDLSDEHYSAFIDRKSTRLNSSHVSESRMPSSA